MSVEPALAGRDPRTGHGGIAAWIDGVLVPMDKLAVHRAGLRHPAVSVFVMDGARTLLQRRARGKYHTPGLWANACCTHPHWGEAPEICASRRLAEELGLRIGPDRLASRGRVEYRADVGGGLVEHEVVDIFTVEAGSAPALAPDPEEVMATRWIDLAALRDAVAGRPQDFTPWLRIYLAEHSRGIFGTTA